MNLPLSSYVRQLMSVQPRSSAKINTMFGGGFEPNAEVFPKNDERAFVGRSEPNGEVVPKIKEQAFAGCSDPDAELASKIEEPARTPRLQGRKFVNKPSIHFMVFISLPINLLPGLPELLQILPNYNLILTKRAFFLGSRHQNNVYIKGASAELCEETINAPRSTRKMAIGINHHFLRTFRKCQNSFMIEILLIA